MPNNRIQTPDLAPEDRLNTEQVQLDTYSRPAPAINDNSLQQLAQSLSTLNPGLNAMLAKKTDADYQEQQKVNAAQGLLDRKSIATEGDALAAMNANRGKWSDIRMKNFEMADAQIHANTYPAALEQKLRESGLWNNEQADPKQVAEAMAQVRQQYLQRGTGTGPEWGATFDQYSSGFERGMMDQWVQHVGHVREAKAEQMIGNDLTTQILAHQQMDSVDDIAKGIHDYAEKSYTNKVLYPGQINQIMVKAIVAAHSAALNTGNVALAERIEAAYEKIPTRDDNGSTQYLARTTYGGEASAEMHQALYYHNRDARSEKLADKDELRQTTLAKVFDIQEPFRGKMPTDIPATFPGDQDLRRTMTSLGLDPEREWAAFRQRGLEAALQNSSEVGQVRSDQTRTADDDVANLRTQLRMAAGRDDLAKVTSAIVDLDRDPNFKGAAARERLNDLITEAQQQKKRYDDTGKLGSPAYRLSATDVASVGRAMAYKAQSAIKQFQRDESDTGFLGRTMSRFMQPSPDAEGNVSYGFQDLDRQMQKEFSDEADAAEGQLPWDQVPRNALRDVSDRIIKKYQPLYEQRIKDVETQLKADQKKQADAVAQSQQTTEARNVATGTTFTVKGPSGVPTADAINNVKTATGTLAYATAYYRDNPLISSKMVGPDSADVDATLMNLDDLKGPSVYDSFFDIGAQRTSQAGYIRKFAHEDAPAGFDPPQTSRGIPFIWNSSYTADVKSPMVRLKADLETLEADPKLLEAVHHTAVTGQMDGYEGSTQALYARKRFDYLRLAMGVGFPTNLSTADKPPFKPEWVDFATVPLFSRSADVTDENLDKVIKNLKLSPTDYRMAPIFTKFNIKPSTEAVRNLVKQSQLFLIKKRAEEFRFTDQ